MKTVLLLLTPLVLLSPTVSTASEKKPPLETVKSVDLKKYVGLWYEISKIPNRFQKQCAGGTTAEYMLLDNGKVQVINRCREADGNTDSAKGVARVVDKETNAKLQVSFVRFFGRNWFWGDYWVIGLDEDYQWAIVGHPKRTYGWILSRTPKLGPEALKKCNEILREKGYNPANFVATEQ